MVRQVIGASFKPEFINRLDEIIVFDRLGSEQIHSIVTLQLQALADRLKGRGYTLSWDDAVVDAIYEEGYDPLYGARPIRRAIQRMVEDSLSVQLLAGTFADGAKIHLSMNGAMIEATSR